MKTQVRFIEPAIKTGRINPTPTLEVIVYMKKVLSFKLIANLKFKSKETHLYDQIYFP